MIIYIATLTVDAQVSFKKQIPYYKKCPKYNIEVFKVHCNSIKEASYNTTPRPSFVNFNKDGVLKLRKLGNPLEITLSASVCVH